ncbi:hypothetical protein GobsT_46830 [Gemmata obscuriglobus]|uniref:Uncharacterized protein n=1 Tax=Gemmata obscuriglobus TaxID=114 RepID=A0A2Z3H949_9BACT|nr:hypothetical protein [Gemmata obscuriglobus]AWM37354.1 hypothetical protein C1280_10235 [Gemmata obscuriglobus]AWM37600.1 hypothetical protein C1280_11700 [Gemmata obscuriglobus]QEG29611.1 hypothetical protein GobsT_44090 [Gemmata obscuriglobus]QEG29884.1 hypothetical protein GobsT_46830 [Gemmata obscuriglobus]VTS08903.1 unnamed protein product [Gemmata obscuriglobus UQM 2246]
MAIDGNLLSLLHELDRSSADAVIRFYDGEAYGVRVISTAHADAGGDVIAEILTVAAGSIPVGAFMNFALTDVAEVRVGGTCAFAAPSG